MPTKRSERSPGEKLLSLYTLLMMRGEQRTSLAELARLLECTKQTVLRLLDQLEASGYGKLDAPEKVGREHFYRLAPLPSTGLNIGLKELMQLNVCRNLLLRLLPKGANELLPNELLADKQNAHQSPFQRILPNSFAAMSATYHKGYIDYAPFDKQYHILLNAIRAQKVCSVTYKRAPAAKERTFYFAPLRLISYRESLSFLGWEVDDAIPVAQKFDNTLSLYLQRITQVSMTEGDASHLPNPIPAHDQQGINAFGIMPGTPFRVRLLFSQEPAAYVYDRVWSNRQSMTVHDDGSLTLDFDAQNGPEIVSWVLSFGAKVTVLEPEWLQEEVKRQSDDVSVKY